MFNSRPERTGSSVWSLCQYDILGICYTPTGSGVVSNVSVCRNNKLSVCPGGFGPPSPSIIAISCLRRGWTKASTDQNIELEFVSYITVGLAQLSKYGVHNVAGMPFSPVLNARHKRFSFEFEWPIGGVHRAQRTTQPGQFLNLVYSDLFFSARKMLLTSNNPYLWVRVRGSNNPKVCGMIARIRPQNRRHFSANRPFRTRVIMHAQG